MLNNFNKSNKIPLLLEFEHLIWQRNLNLVAGIDEAGRGPLAGPVVAAAVVFPKYFFIDGIRDSKKLSAAKRELFFEQITRSCTAFGIGMVEPAEIDRINIHQATFKAMRKAISDLRIQPDYLLFDGYELPEKFYRQEALIKGDNRSFTIAAASILAKVTRDRLMLQYHEKYPEYQFHQHKGYGTKKHREIIQAKGPCPIHRHSFLKKILNSNQ